MTQPPNSVTEVFETPTTESLNTIMDAHQPVVFRGIVKNWPIVQAAQLGHAAFTAYIKRFDIGYELDTTSGPPSIQGRLFYNTDMSGLNFRMSQTKLSATLDFLLAHKNDEAQPLLAIQSSVISRYLPGLDTENRLAILPSNIEPRIWIGGKTTVAAHYDPSENIACCIAGRRRFTLYPPDQIKHLYMGPFELTPAGTTISLVNSSQPELEKHPNFMLAQQAALTCELTPGDAIYIPYLWWHQVESLDSINGLINYWWGEAQEAMRDPRAALLHTIAAIRNLPEPHKKAWKAHFEHYAFSERSEAEAHIPESQRGILGQHNSDLLRKLKAGLIKALSKY